MNLPQNGGAGRRALCRGALLVVQGYIVIVKVAVGGGWVASLPIYRK